MWKGESEVASPSPAVQLQLTKTSDTTVTSPTKDYRVSEKVGLFPPDQLQLQASLTNTYIPLHPESIGANDFDL